MTRIKIVLISFFLLLIYAETYAQNFKLKKSQSKLIVKGTSSLHDWSLKATKMDGEVNFDLDSVLHIKKLTLFVQVAGLKGDKKGMVKKMQNTLQITKYASVHFQFEKLDTLKQISYNNYEVNITGNLTIAGKTRQIELLLNMVVFDNKISIKGYKNIKMTDYDIKPPRALMGILKTGESVKVSFNIFYQ